MRLLGLTLGRILARPSRSLCFAPDRAVDDRTLVAHVFSQVMEHSLRRGGVTASAMWHYTH